MDMSCDVGKSSRVGLWVIGSSASCKEGKVLLLQVLIWSEDGKEKKRG